MSGTSLNRLPGINGSTAFWLTIKANYEPKLLTKITVNTATRNQLTSAVGYSETTKDTANKIICNDALTNNGGAFYFNGNTTGSDANFVLDCTSLLMELVPLNGRTMRWYLSPTDNTTGSPIILKDFKLVNTLTGKEISNLNKNYPQTIDFTTISNYIDYSFQ